jgi:hypothetical protein
VNDVLEIGPVGPAKGHGSECAEVDPVQWGGRAGLPSRGL